MPVTASTAFDQCEQVANAVLPVFRHLQQRAADARHYHLDDTSHRILDQAPIQKRNATASGSSCAPGFTAPG
ncbi:MAG: hypothetical protein IPM37_16465 [Hahellaceae bacterium]|nr:hypothetical protein [Hahellaceae bacterium]